MVLVRTAPSAPQSVAAGDAVSSPVPPPDMNVVLTATVLDFIPEGMTTLGPNEKPDAAVLHDVSVVKVSGPDKYSGVVFRVMHAEAGVVKGAITEPGESVTLTVRASYLDRCFRRVGRDGIRVLEASELLSADQPDTDD